MQNHTKKIIGRTKPRKPCETNLYRSIKAKLSVKYPRLWVMVKPELSRVIKNADYSVSIDPSVPDIGSAMIWSDDHKAPEGFWNYVAAASEPDSCWHIPDGWPALSTYEVAAPCPVVTAPKPEVIANPKMYELFNNLKDIMTNGSGRWGLCKTIRDNFAPRDSYAMREFMQEHQVNWKYFTGSATYPVPSPVHVLYGKLQKVKKETLYTAAQGAYQDSMNKFDNSPYGKLRQDLLDFLIAQAKG